MNLDTSRIENWPVVTHAIEHPRIAAWIVLSLGMVILLAIEARDVGLLASQWIALIVATVLVAGACVWIISWEDADEEIEAGGESASQTTTAETEETAVEASDEEPSSEDNSEDERDDEDSTDTSNEDDQEK